MNQRWKYFSDAEVQGLQDDLIFKLDRARELYGEPIIITSGYRSPAENDAVGGVKRSAHTEGKTVDIRCPNPLQQMRLIWALTIAGFRRVGQYSSHIHVDIELPEDNRPSPAFWNGGDSH